MSTEGQKTVEKNKYIAVEANTFTSTKVSGKVAGSSSVSPVMEKLIEAYKSVNPNVKVELQTSDSTTGVANAGAIITGVPVGLMVTVPLSYYEGVRTLTANIVIEMGYAADLYREALIATGVVLFVFILGINVAFNAVKSRDKNN